MADAVGAVGGRLDVEVDDADAARLEHRHALRDRGLGVGRAGDRADTDRTLRLRELGDVGRGVLHAQPNPAVLHLAGARLRHRLLVQLVVEVGAVVVDENEQREIMKRVIKMIPKDALYEN